LHVYELVERLDKLLDWIVRLQVFESQFLESHGLEKPLFFLLFSSKKKRVEKNPGKKPGKPKKIKNQKISKNQKFG